MTKSRRSQLDKRVNQLDDGAGEEVERDQVGDGNDGGKQVPRQGKPDHDPQDAQGESHPEPAPLAILQAEGQENVHDGVDEEPNHKQHRQERHTDSRIEHQIKANQQVQYANQDQVPRITGQHLFQLKVVHQD